MKLLNLPVRLRWRVPHVFNGLLVSLRRGAGAHDTGGPHCICNTLLPSVAHSEHAQSHSANRAETIAVVSPWQPLRRSSGLLYGVRNRSQEALHQVRVLLAGYGAFAQSLPTTVSPGEYLKFKVGNAASSDRAAQTLVVRWLDKRTGKELLWSAPVH